jgi:hypothetical protein
VSKVAHATRTNLHVVGQIRPAAQVNDDVGQRLVQRAARFTEAANAALVAERVFERLSQGQANILHRVMIIDFEIALGLNVDVEKSVAAEGVKHVVEKRHAGFDRRLPAAIDVQRYLDIGLFGFTLDLSCPSHDYLPKKL